MATRDRGNIVRYILNTSLLGFFQRLALLALFVLVSGQSAQAASEPPSVAAPAAQAPLHLAWDRVGSPIQIRA
jgi:hypothetical protein